MASALHGGQPEQEHQNEKGRKRKYSVLATSTTVKRRRKNKKGEAKNVSGSIEFLTVVETKRPFDILVRSEGSVVTQIKSTCHKME